MDIILLPMLDSKSVNSIKSVKRALCYVKLEVLCNRYTQI